MVCLKDYKMPETCEDCTLESYFSLWVDARRTSDDGKRATTRHQDYPLIEVPKQKHGKWIWNSHNGFSYCSCCNAVSPHEDQYGEYCDRPNYCPNCGSDMKTQSVKQLRCKKCGSEMFEVHGTVVICPNCGADMRGDSDV